MSFRSRIITIADVRLACGELTQREAVAVQWCIDSYTAELAEIDEALAIVFGEDGENMTRAERIMEMERSEGVRTAGRPPPRLPEMHEHQVSDGLDVHEVYVMDARR